MMHVWIDCEMNPHGSKRTGAGGGKEGGKKTAKWNKTRRQGNLIKKRQFYLVLSKFSFLCSVNDLVILPFRSKPAPSICSAVLSKDVISQQNTLHLKRKPSPHMEASLDSCGIIYLFIYLSHSYNIDMIVNPRLLFNASPAPSVLGCGDDGHSSITACGIMATLPMS